jgi:hypothetical protein
MTIFLRATEDPALLTALCVGAGTLLLLVTCEACFFTPLDLQAHPIIHVFLNKYTSILHLWFFVVTFAVF